MRTVNTKFFVFLVISLVLSSIAIIGLHRLQASNIAEALLWQAEQAEKDGKLDRAARYLARYLEFGRDDLDRREQLGLIQSDPKFANTPQRRAKARFVIEQVLAKDPNRHLLRNRLCQLLISSRKFESAKEHLTLLEKAQPQSAEPVYLTGLWHESQNQLAPAVAAYRLAVQRDPAKADAYLRLIPALKQLDFGKKPRHGEEISALVQAMLEKAPHDAGVLSLAAQDAQDHGDGKVARRYLEDGLKRFPTEPRLYLALARIHGQSGDRAVAAEKLQEGLRKVAKAHQADIRWGLANVLLDDNRLEDAAKIVQEIRETNAASADYLQARMQIQRGRWFDAVRQLEKIRPSLRTNKELAMQIDLYLGHCYENLEEPVQMLVAFQRAADADSTSVAAMRGIAKARWALGQTQDSLRDFADVAAKTKDPREAAHRRLELVRKLIQRPGKRNAKELDEIETHLTAIEKTLVKSIDIALVRSELAFLQGNKSGAEKMLQDIVAEYPDRHEPWLALIALAGDKNEPKLARQLLETAEKKFKDKADFRLAQVRFWSQHHDAEANAGMKRLEDALSKFSAIEQSAILQALAETYFYANQLDDSMRAMKLMLGLPMHMHDVRVRVQMLEVAVSRSDDKQAKELLDDIKRIDGESADWSFGEALRIVRLAPKAGRETHEKARHLLTMAAAQRPNWAPIMQVRAELDELQGRPDQAIANYRRAIEHGSRDPAATRNLLVLLSQAHRYQEVDLLLLTMQKQFGATEEVVRYYVASSFQRRDYRKAEYLVKQIVSANSTNYRDQLWVGQILGANGQANPEAEAAFRKAVALAPHEPDAWFNLIRFLVGAGNYTEAFAEVENVRKKLPADRQDLVLAQCLELLGQRLEAWKHYGQAVEKQPNAITHKAAADFAMRVSRWADAEILYRKLHEKKVAAKEDDAKAARHGLALALARQGTNEKRIEALKLAGFAVDDNGMPIDGTVPEQREEQILQAKVLGSFAHHRLRDKAIAMLESLQRKSPLNDEERFFLARICIDQGSVSPHFAKAIALLKSLTQDQPRNVRYLTVAARELLEQKELADAEPIIARLERVERERKMLAGGFGSIELRAKLLELRGEGTQAVALLTEYADQSTAFPMRRLLLAHLHGRLGQYREAIDLCDAVRKAGKAGSLDVEANAAAVAILCTNKPSEAQPTSYQAWRREFDRVEADLRESLKSNAKEPSIRLFLANLMELQGRYDEVERLCRDVLRDHDTNLVALNNLAWLLSQRPTPPEEALSLIERAIAKYGLRPELRGTRAIVLLNMGKPADALQDMQRVVEEEPTATRYFYLTRAHAKLKNATVAQTTLRRANEMGLTLQQLHPVEQAEFRRVSSELGLR